MDYPKADITLKLQALRMQLETLAYVRIKLKKADESIIEDFSKAWLNCCKQEEVEPENSFHEEFKEFQKETVLKFAREKTLENMEKKSLLTIEKMGFDGF